MPESELDDLDPQVERDGTRLLMVEGDIERGLALLTRAARAGSPSALATHSWWCLQHGYEDWALELGADALPVCESRASDPKLGVSRFNVANGASNLALCRLALRSDSASALETWSKGESAGHAESSFYPAVLASREGREEDAQRLIERLPPPVWTRLRRLMDEVSSAPSSWFSQWCTDGAALLDRYPCDPMAVDLIDFEGLLIDPAYADDWSEDEQRAEAAAKSGMEMLRELTTGEGGPALIARLKLGALLVGQSDQGSPEYREGWQHLWAAAHSTDVRTVREAFWAITLELLDRGVDQQSSNDFFYGCLALGHFRAVTGLVTTLRERGSSEILRQLLGGAECVIGRTSPVHDASQELLKMTMAYLSDPPEDISVILGSDSSPRVRACVVQNPETSHEVRRSLIETCTGDVELLQELLGRRNTAEDVLLEIAPSLMPWESDKRTEEQGQGRFVSEEPLGPALVALAQHENAPDDLLRKLASPQFHQFLVDKPRVKLQSDDDAEPLPCLCYYIQRNQNISLHLWGTILFSEYPRGTYLTHLESAFGVLRATLLQVRSEPIAEQAKRISEVMKTEFEDMSHFDSTWFIKVLTAVADPTIKVKAWSDLDLSLPVPPRGGLRYGVYGDYDFEMAGRSLRVKGAEQRIAFALAMADSRNWLPEPHGSLFSHEPEDCASAFLAWTGLVVDDPELVERLVDLVVDDSQLSGTEYLAVGLAANPTLESDALVRLALTAGDVFVATNPSLPRELSVATWGRVDRQSYVLETLLKPPSDGPFGPIEIASSLVADATQDVHSLKAWTLLLEGMAIARDSGVGPLDEERGSLASMAEAAVDTFELYEGFGDDAEDEVLIALMQSHESLADLVRVSGWEQADTVLVRSSCATEGELVRIARDGDVSARVATAASKAIPAELLSTLAMDESPWVRTAAYANPKSTEADRTAAALLGIDMQSIRLA